MELSELVGGLGIILLSHVPRSMGVTVVGISNSFRAVCRDGVSLFPPWKRVSVAENKRKLAQQD